MVVFYIGYEQFVNKMGSFASGALRLLPFFHHQCSIFSSSLFYFLIIHILNLLPFESIYFSIVALRASKQCTSQNSPFNYKRRGNAARVLFKIKQAGGNKKKKKAEKHDAQ